MTRSVGRSALPARRYASVNPLARSGTATGAWDKSNQTRLIAQDEDSGTGFNSRIVADLAVGVYFARVRHCDPQGTGAYSISVRR